MGNQQGSFAATRQVATYDGRIVLINENCVLGAGSFAKVVQGQMGRGKDARLVAVKMIDKNTIQDRSKGNTGVNPEKEMRICGSITMKPHPNIVNFYGCAEDDEYMYIIMEMLNGSDLHSVVKNKPLPEAEAKKYFVQIVEAVDYLHRQDIVHRDLKLENCMLTTMPNGTKCVKVIDFGLADVMKDEFTDFPGSAPYASPQLALGVPYNGRAADVWAIGVILYAMLTSEYPYWDASTTRLFRMIIQLPPPIDRPQFSPALRDLLSRLLDKFPQKRITLEEVRDHPWCRDEFIAARLALKSPARVGKSPLRHSPIRSPLKAHNHSPSPRPSPKSKKGSLRSLTPNRAFRKIKFDP